MSRKIQEILEKAVSVINTFFHLFFPGSRFWHYYQVQSHESKEDCLANLTLKNSSIFSAQQRTSAPSEESALNPWISKTPPISYEAISEVITNFEGAQYRRFIYRTRLLTSTIVTYFKSLNLPSDTDIFMFSQSGDQSNLNDIAQTIKNSEKTRIAIPLIVSHGDDNLHIVCLFIDKRRNSIQFFDSQGYSYNDTDKNTLASPLGFRSQNTVKNLIDKLIGTQENYQISEFGERCQFDSDQCGLFVSYAIKQFIERKDLQDMASSSGKMREFPAEMALSIVQKYLDLPVN